MALYIQKSSVFEATAENFASGLTGTLGVRILDNQGGTVGSRHTGGIIELFPGSGTYAATLTAPSVPGEYSIVWDDGQTGPGHIATEDLSVISTTTIQVATGTEGMTFGQILDDVLDNPLRFEQDLRGRAGRSVNIRYAHVWGLEDWTFRFANCTMAAQGSLPVLSPDAADFGTPLYLWDQNGTPLVYMETEEFAANYPPGTGSGTAESWTVISGDIYVAPNPGSGSFRCYYRRRFTALVDESAYPMLPPEYHLTLVHGGRAELLAVSDDPTYNHMEAQFQADIEAMKREYLIDAIGQPEMWPTDYSTVA